MILHLPNDHTVEIETRAGDGCSTTWVRLDGGPWARSRIASMHKLAARWIDTKDVDETWRETT